MLTFPQILFPDFHLFSEHHYFSINGNSPKHDSSGVFFSFFLPCSCLRLNFPILAAQTQENRFFIFRRVEIMDHNIQRELLKMDANKCQHLETNQSARIRGSQSLTLFRSLIPGIFSVNFLFDMLLFNSANSVNFAQKKSDCLRGQLRKVQEICSLLTEEAITTPVADKMYHQK